MNRRRRNRLRAAGEPYSKGLNTKRGRDYFVVALITLPIVVGLRALTDGPIFVPGAVAFVIIFAVLAGVIGTFREDVGF